MNVEAIAKAYIDCVELEEKSQTAAPCLADDLANLRADLHALLMEALRQARIPFVDRADAARQAYAIAGGLHRDPIGIPLKTL